MYDVLSLLQKLSSGLQKTKSSLVEGIHRVVSKARGLDEEVLEGLEEQLLLSDMGWETVELIEGVKIVGAATLNDLALDSGATMWF